MRRKMGTYDVDVHAPVAGGDDDACGDFVLWGNERVLCRDDSEIQAERPVAGRESRIDLFLLLALAPHLVWLLPQTLRKPCHWSLEERIDKVGACIPQCP